MRKLKELDIYHAGIQKPTQLGGVLSIVGGNFAEPVENDELLKMAVGYGLPESQIENARSLVEGTGFKRRFISSSPDVEVDVEGTVKRVVEIGSMLVSDAVKARGWDSLDLLIDTSAVLPTNINRTIVERAGFNTEKVEGFSARYACAGAVVETIRVMANPELADARVVVLALEPLSMYLDRSHYLTAADLAFPSIFTDAYWAAAFKPGDFQVRDQLVRIEDDSGVIQMRALYDFENEPSDPTTIPSYYEFVGDTKNILRHSKHTGVLKIRQPDDGRRASIDGPGTGMFFGNKTYELLANRVAVSGDPDLLNNMELGNVVYHPASRPVSDRINKLSMRNKVINKPKLLFLMDEPDLLQANGSSATTLIRLDYMLRKNMVNPFKEMVWVAPGIGSAIAYARVRIVNPK